MASLTVTEAWFINALLKTQVSLVRLVQYYWKKKYYEVLQSYEEPVGPGLGLLSAWTQGSDQISTVIYEYWGQSTSCVLGKVFYT